jgi:putative aminopeptidase FrvX
MILTKTTYISPLVCFLCIVFASFSTKADTSYAWDSMLKLAANYDNRVGGSSEERQAGDWLISEFSRLGYEVKTQAFSFSLNKKTLTSRNLEVTIKGKSDKTLLIGAHYDAVPSVEGSSGLADNASGVGTILGLASNLKGKQHDYTIRLVLFGAEEVGLQGAKHYVNSAALNRKNLVGMINLDTVIGGDNLYIHSAHSKPYQCDYVKDANYSYQPNMRDQLLATAQALPLESLYSKHPDTKDYAAGETGSWSDHAPFACLGLPIAYIEATNFSIHGEDGYDGYSQTTKNEFWSCFNEQKLTACNREKEKNWGKIWHTKFDQGSYLITNLEQQIKTQFNANIKLLTHFILHQTLNE